MTRGRGAVRAVAALIATVLLGISACSSSHSSEGGGGRSTPITVTGSRTLSGTELTYGPSVGAIPGAVYQSDVVLIGGGANAIRGADSTGLTWTIDANAPGASRLEVGKVMVATSFATGRVLALKHTSSGVQVTLGPVALTDVFSDLDIGSSSSGVGLQQPIAYSYPDSPANSASADGATTGAGPDASTPSVAPTAPKQQQGFLQPSDAGAPSSTVSLPEPTLTPPTVKQGEFTLTPYCCSPSQGVRIAYNNGAGLMAAKVGIVTNGNPLLDFHITISGGGLKEAVFELHGPSAIEFSFEASTKDVSGNYKSPVLRIPVALTFPLAGIPFTITLTQSIYGSIQLAGQAAFSTAGQYTISGATLGFSYRNGHFGAVTPSISTKLSALENATSLAVGINALTLGYGARLSAGIGVLGFNAGPYIDLGASLAIDKDGSPPQTSLKAGCATAAVYVQGSYGVGYQIPKVVADFVNTFLNLVNAKPIASSGGKNWGPYTLWNPGKSQRCLER